MSLPKDWEWLDEVPDEWVPPGDLRGPTNNPRIDLPIQMLSSGALGNDLIDLVGQFLSEGARFNMWFAVEAKPKSSMKELAQFSLVMNEQIRLVYEAWSDFTTTYHRVNKMVAEFRAEEDLLRSVLSEAIANVAEVRTRHR